MHAVGAAPICLVKLREAYASTSGQFQLMVANLKSTLKMYGSLDINLFEHVYLLPGDCNTKLNGANCPCAVYLLNRCLR